MSTVRLWSIIAVLAAAVALASDARTDVMDLFGLAPSQTEQGNSLSETERYSEVAPGESGWTSFFLWAPRYFSISDVRGFDDTLNRQLLGGMQLASFRYEGVLDYRLSRTTSILVRPSAGLGYAYSSIEGHGLFQLATVNQQVEMPARFQQNLLTFEGALSVGVRNADSEVFGELRSIWGWRFQRVKARREVYALPGGGGLYDTIQQRVDRNTDLARVDAWGIGYAYYAGADPWNFRLALSLRPFSQVEFKDFSGELHGFALDARMDGLRLSDDLAVALQFRLDAWLPSDGFNDLFFFEVGIGIRFS